MNKITQGIFDKSFKPESSIVGNVYQDSVISLTLHSELKSVYPSDWWRAKRVYKEKYLNISDVDSIIKFADLTKTHCVYVSTQQVSVPTEIKPRLVLEYDNQGLILSCAIGYLAQAYVTKEMNLHLALINGEIIYAKNKFFPGTLSNPESMNFFLEEFHNPTTRRPGFTTLNWFPKSLETDSAVVQAIKNYNII